MIVCGDCGSIYGSKVWHSNTKNRKIIWQCNSKFKNEKKCTTPHLTEDMIKSAFVETYNGLVQNKDEIIALIEKTIQRLLDTAGIDKRIVSAKRAAENRSKKVSDYIDLNKRTPIKQKEYNAHFDELTAELEQKNAVVTQLEQEKTDMLSRSRKCEIYLGKVKESSVIQDFDDELFRAIVDRITVYEDKLIFLFKDGSELAHSI